MITTEGLAQMASQKERHRNALATMTEGNFIDQALIDCGWWVSWVDKVEGEEVIDGGGSGIVVQIESMLDEDTGEIERTFRVRQPFHGRYRTKHISEHRLRGQVPAQPRDLANQARQMCGLIYRGRGLLQADDFMLLADAGILVGVAAGGVI